MPQEGESGRVRAWVLAKAQNPADAAERIWNEEVGVDKTMIVRADVVSGAQPKNIVVPVDAADRNGLDAAKTIITRETGDRALTVAEVDSHHPSDPHSGRGQMGNGIEGNNAWG